MFFLSALKNKTGKKIYSALVSIALLGGCAYPIENLTPQQVALMQSAPMPTPAAEKVIEEWFSPELHGIYSFQFPTPPKQGAIHYLWGDYVGWFWCGTITNQNLLGQITNRQVFIVYFTPTKQNEVDFFSKSEEWENVEDMCRMIYSGH